MIKPAAILLSLCLFDVSKAGEMNLELVNLIEQVYIESPSDISIQKDFPVEDFMLTNFSSGGKSFLKAYVGNAPSFPSEECSGEAIDKVVYGLRSKEIKCSGDELAVEVLVSLGVDNGWPQYVHFMLRKSDEYESIGVDIMDSIRTKT